MEHKKEHKDLHKLILEIREGNFVLSSINPLNHITATQNKIENFIKVEETRKLRGYQQRINDAKEADLWLGKVFLDLVDSGATWK